MISRRQVLAGSAAVTTLAACSPKAGEGARASGGHVLRLATDWRAEAEHGGIYQAFATGEYQKRGLDVRIIPGGPGVNVPQYLAAGSADLGIGSNAFGVMNLVREKVPVRAVMASMQKDPQVLMAHPGAGIGGLADLKGHPILLSDSAKTSFWLWLKAKYGLTDDQVRTYTFNAGPFLSDTRAVQEGYVTSEPYTVETEGHIKPVVMLLADNGYPGYAGMILAPNALIEKSPDAVRAFVEATSAGWNSFLNGDASKADGLILRDNPEMKPAILTQAREKMKSYGIIQPVGGAPIGAMTEANWKAFFDTASGLGVYRKDLDWRSAYTLDFLPKG